MARRSASPRSTPAASPRPVRTPTSLLLQRSYRRLGHEESQLAEVHLHGAADALNMALLTLDGSPDEGAEAKLSRVTSARNLLAEAVTALARARVYLPGIRTYAVNVIASSERELDRELARLHQLATTLLWHNHALLPARDQAEPLAPEDEAQLAAVVRELATHARLERATRYKWLVATAFFGVLAPVLGIALYLCAVVSGTMAAIELARGSSPPVLPST